MAKNSMDCDDASGPSCIALDPSIDWRSCLEKDLSTRSEVAQTAPTPSVSAAQIVLPTATAIAAGLGTLGREPWNRGYPRSERAATFPAFWSPGTQREGPAGGDAAGLRGRCFHPSVEDLIKSLGYDGISKNQVSRICRDLVQMVLA